jgi:predicted acetyltransferase
MYLYTLKQHQHFGVIEVFVVNRFKKNVSLHVETTLYELDTTVNRHVVVNRFKKNVSLHVETTFKVSNKSLQVKFCCESL